MARLFTSVSVETTLSATISSSATSITVANAAALLGDITIGASDQFTVAIDPDTASEEIVFVTAANTSTNTLTVTRGRAGTSAITHASGAQVKHVLTSSDLTAFEATTNTAITAASTSTLTNKTIALGSNTVSGTTAQFNTALTDGDFATLAGSETLTNKNLTSGTNTFPTSLATLTGAQTLTNKTIDYNSNTITNLPSATSQTLLSTTTLSGSSTTISSISGSYNELYIYVYAVEQSSICDITVSFNSGIGSIYQAVNWADTGGATTGTSSAQASNAFKITLPTTKGTGSANNWLIKIANYAGNIAGSRYTSLKYDGGYADGTSGTVRVVNGAGSIDLNANAINAITFTPSTGTFLAGTVKIYGVK